MQNKKNENDKKDIVNYLNKKIFINKKEKINEIILEVENEIKLKDDLIIKSNKNKSIAILY